MRAVALITAFALISPAFAQDAGVSDAPKAVRLENGSLLLNKAAADAVDLEMTRLQGQERVHKGESWVTVVLISVGAGILMGAAAGVAVTLAVKPAPAAAPPSP